MQVQTRFKYPNNKQQFFPQKNKMFFYLALFERWNASQAFELLLPGPGRSRVYQTLNLSGYSAAIASSSSLSKQKGRHYIKKWLYKIEKGKIK